MVRSGASTNWFLAARPTRSRPCGSSPTTDGRIGSPSSSRRTTGRPSRMTATSLLVVPRSIPMMVSIDFSFSALANDIVLVIVLVLVLVVFEIRTEIRRVVPAVRGGAGGADLGIAEH